MNVLKLSVCLSMILMFATAARAEIITISTADGLGADTQIRGLIGTDNQSADNFGLVDNLAYRWATAGTTGVDRFQKVMIRFQLPNNIESIQSATLRLYRTSTVSKEIDVYALRELSDYGPGQQDEFWGETTVTWANAPFHEGIAANSNGLASGTFTLIADSVTAPATTGTQSISNASLLSFLEADTNGVVTFLIRAEDNETAVGIFASKEHDGTGFTGLHAPQLVLDYTIMVPEPSTFVLSGLGLTLLAAYSIRKRRQT